MWLPSVLLLTARTRSHRAVEGLIVAGGCGVLALATDRFRPWPRALALPAAVAVLLHVVDLALGSDLVQRSLLGPNPVLGLALLRRRQRAGDHACRGRAAGAGRRCSRRASPRARVWGFAIGGGVLAFTMAWGRLGADVGAVRPSSPAPRSRRWSPPGRRPPGARASRSCSSLRSRGSPRSPCSTSPRAGTPTSAARCSRPEGSTRSRTSRSAASAQLPVAGARRDPVPGGVRPDRAGGGLQVRAAALLAATEAAPGVRAAVYGLLAAVLAGALTNDSGPDHPADRQQLPGCSRRCTWPQCPIRAARTPATEEQRLSAADRH